MTVPVCLLVCLQRDFQSLQLSWHKTFHGCANRQTCVSTGSCFNEPQGLTANLALLRAAICWSQENYLFQDLSWGAVCGIVELQCLESITTPFAAAFSSCITWDTIHFSSLKTSLSSLYPSGHVDHPGVFATDFGRIWFRTFIWVGFSQWDCLWENKFQDHIPGFYILLFLSIYRSRIFVSVAILASGLNPLWLEPMGVSITNCHWRKFQLIN